MERDLRGTDTPVEISVADTLLPAVAVELYGDGQVLYRRDTKPDTGAADGFILICSAGQLQVDPDYSVSDPDYSVSDPDYSVSDTKKDRRRLRGNEDAAGGAVCASQPGGDRQLAWTLRNLNEPQLIRPATKM